MLKQTGYGLNPDNIVETTCKEENAVSSSVISIMTKLQERWTVDQMAKYRAAT